MKKEENFYSMLYAYFGNRLLDEEMRSWLQRKLNCRKKGFNEGLFRFLPPATHNKRSGRTPLCPDIREMAFDMWVEHSIISVDGSRRNVIKNATIKHIKNNYMGLKHLS